MKSRGNKLYQGSRIILPEHREMIRRQDEEEKKQPKPELDEQQEEVISTSIMESLFEKRTVRITYYSDGHIYAMVGVVRDWDMYTQTLRVQDEDGELQRLKWDDILNAELI